MIKSLILVLVMFCVLDPASAQVKKRIKKGHRNKSESRYRHLPQPGGSLWYQ